MAIDPATIKAPEDWEPAVPVLEYALERVRREHRDQAEYRLDLLEQLRICELLMSEAAIAEKQIEKLLDGDVYANGDEINARWDAMRVAPVWAGAEAPVEVPAPEEPAPDPAPEPVAIAKAEPAEAPPTLALPCAAEAVAPLIADKLDQLMADNPIALTATIIGQAIGEPVGRVYPALYLLAERGVIQYVQRKDKAQRVVLRPGETLPFPDLSANQQKVFDAMVGIADREWLVRASLGGISAVAGLSPGSVSQVIDALTKKGFIATVDRGDSRKPATHIIAEGHRPARVAPPKTDAELVAEALSAGKVTACPPRFATGSVETH